MTDSPKGFEAWVVAGPEGPALYLNNYRIAGPKPWAGGSVTAEWKGRTVEDLFAAVPELRALRESHDALATALNRVADLIEATIETGTLPAHTGAGNYARMRDHIPHTVNQLPYVPRLSQ